MHLILLPNDSIFRALSDGIYRIFSVPDPKNTFCVINQCIFETEMISVISKMLLMIKVKNSFIKNLGNFN